MEFGIGHSIQRLTFESSGILIPYVQIALAPTVVISSAFSPLLVGSVR